MERNVPQRPPNGQDTSRRDQALDELRAIRAELRAMRELFDEFARVYLNARFCGQGADRWSRRR